MRRRHIAGISTAVAASVVIGMSPAHAVNPTQSLTGTPKKPSEPVEIPADLLNAKPTDSQIKKNDFEVPDGYVMDSFYKRPASWPKEPGRLIKHKKEKLTGWVGSIGEMNAEMTVMMYTTTNYAGDVVPVTGAYLEPRSPWKGKGTRPLVTYSYGTIGVGDQCAPSVSLKTPMHIQPRSLSVNYEMISITKFIDQGIPVVQTDYVGLGMPGDHTYVNSTDQAHAVLDAVRAARELPGAPIDKKTPVAAYGYSQGGAASASAAERQPEYAPDVNLKAVYAGSPAADLNEVMTGVDGSPLSEAIGYTTNGLTRYHPSLGYVMEAETNKKGRQVLEEIKTRCVIDSAFSSNSLQPSSQWMKSGENLKKVVARYPAVSEMVKKQRVGNLKPSVPARIATSVHDDVVPHTQAKQLAVDWCEKGTNVEYVPIHDVELPRKTAANHLMGMILDQANAIKWTTDMMTGQAKPASNCGKTVQRP